MASLIFFNQFATDLYSAKHDFTSHSFKAMLTNTAPNQATGAIKADITEIAAGNGYTAGGYAQVITHTNVSGVSKLTIPDLTITALGGTMATFRWLVLFNDTQATPAKPLVGYIDLAGAGISLATGQTGTVDYDGTNGVWTDG